MAQSNLTGRTILSTVLCASLFYATAPVSEPKCIRGLIPQDSENTRRCLLQFERPCCVFALLNNLLLFEDPLHVETHHGSRFQPRVLLLAHPRLYRRSLINHP